ncbi:MAG: hypothetical protein C0407_17595, partial [Desulfobacca sp.]|nr:hypothetical protein [Desulfobacca sp.]
PGIWILDFYFRTKEIAGHWFKEMLPAILVFLFSLLFSLYLSDHSVSGSWKVVYRVFLRFFRYALFIMPSPLFIKAHLSLHP